MMGWGLALFGLLIVVFLMLPLAKWQAWQTHYRQQQNVALYRAQVARQSDPELAKELGQRLLEDEKFFQNRPHFEQQSGEKSERFSFKFHLFLIVLLLTVPTLYYFSLPRYAAVEVGEQAFLAL